MDMGDTCVPCCIHRYRQSSSLPPIGVEEHWRNVVADVTSPGHDVTDERFTSELAEWLVKNQVLTSTHMYTYIRTCLLIQCVLVKAKVLLLGSGIWDLG
jgi:hypothetical protein